jgi:hypothetical protein
METPQQIPRGRGIRFIWVLVLMLGSFVGGVFVGLHPPYVWVPESLALPLPEGAGANGVHSSAERPAATQPDTSQSAESAQTQPSTMP